MIVDLSELTKVNTLNTSSEISPNQKQWWPADKTPQLSYNRDFLVGYLLHYCRLCQQMKKQGTIPVLDALLELDPENAEVHYLMARQHEMAGNLQTALDCFERAAALRPDRPTYTLAGVRTACFLGDRNKGLEMVCSVISAYPDMAEAYYERGLIHEADENWGRALNDYQMCTRLEPENPHYLCAEARMYRRQKHYKSARRVASKAVKLDPSCKEAHEELNQLPFLEQFLDFHKPENADAAWKS